MKVDIRNHMIEGTRVELLRTLHQLQDVARHFGNERLVADASTGITDLMSGDISVRVGVMAYDVTEG